MAHTTADSSLRFAHVLNERVAFRLVGGGSADVQLVGVHGLGSEGEDLIALAEASGVGALLLDLPGFGRSGRPDRRHSPGRAARTVLGLLDALEVTRPLVWLGCSYGGHVALRAALDHPRRVAGLVLIGSGGLHRAAPELAAYFEEERLAARTPVDVGLACDALVSRPNAATRAFRARRLARHIGRLPSDYRATSRAVAGAVADDAPARLAQVRVPVELVHGALDPLVPLPVVQSAATTLRQARLTALSHTGHMPWLEDPTAVAECVRRACGVRTFASALAAEAG
jgi:pimeloyl-ACP methyl ester carboxylesterase